MSDTPETDAFMTRIRGIDGDKHWVPADTAKRLERERNAARELAEAFHRDQVTLLLERDRLDKALMKIEDLFVDGTDIYADRENMGLIARAALAQHK